MTRNQLITKIWIMFSFNYGEPKKFIRYICEKAGRKGLEAHLEGKFNDICNVWGSSSVMGRFYIELDSDLANALVDFACFVYAPKGMRLDDEEKRSLQCTETFI